MKLLKRKEAGYFYGAVVLSVIFATLLIYDAVNCKNENVTLYRERTLTQAGEYMAMSTKNGTIDENVLVENIKTGFDTSASVYCVVAVDGEIIFAKDKATTSQLKDTSYDRYFGAPDVTYGQGEVRCNFTAELSDKRTYLVSSVTGKAGEKEITLAICSRKDYVEKQGKFNLLIQHVSLYSVLFALTCMALTFFQLQAKKRLIKQIDDMKAEMTQNRLQIETLETEKMRGQELEMNDKNCGFLSKKTMLAILGVMTPEQKKASCRVKIHTGSDDELLKIAVLLDRTNRKGCVSCLWEEDVFLIVLLNGTREDAKDFVNHIYDSFEQ
ncbi:MAG: hypothetical protein ACI4EV_01090, partial [Lachnospiraceae bacterium]